MQLSLKSATEKAAEPSPSEDKTLLELKTIYESKLTSLKALSESTFNENKRLRVKLQNMED